MTYLILATFFVCCLTTRGRGRTPVFVPRGTICGKGQMLRQKSYRILPSSVLPNPRSVVLSALFVRRTLCLSSVRTTSISDPCLAQRRVIDHKAIFHIALEHALVGFIDLLNWISSMSADDSLLGAEVEHLLGFGDAADGGTRQAAAVP